MANRLVRLASQCLFSTITPLLLMPRIGALRITRAFVSFCFGRAYGSRYQEIIDMFQGRYGTAMAEGLKRARAAAERISIVADCGAGTGFVSVQAAGAFPEAVVLSFDLLPGMLRQARENSRHLAPRVVQVQADTFALPLADDSVDLVLAQNTMPCFQEFARICRQNGAVVYVDSSAGWVCGAVRRLVERTRLFRNVTAGRADMGFFVVAEKPVRAVRR